MTDKPKLYTAIVEGDRDGATSLTQQALDDGVGPKDLIDGSMVPAMAEVGRRFEDEEYFVPELLLSARAMKAALELLRPLLSDQGAEPVGRAVVGTVKGDLHDIGKNLVATLLEGAGFEVVDLGTDVAPEDFVTAVKEKQADLVGLSALLTVTMPSMQGVIEALREAELRDRVKVLVGGAPLTEAYAEDIGADGYAENAAAAVRKAQELLGA